MMNFASLLIHTQLLIVRMICRHRNISLLRRNPHKSIESNVLDGCWIELR